MGPVSWGLVHSARSPQPSCSAAGRADYRADIRGMDIKTADVRRVAVQAV